MRQQQYEAIVIGAGIAGLTSAIALNRSGHTVRLFERHEQVRPLGAGLILWSNAINALSAIGLDHEVSKIGQPLEKLAILDNDSRVLSQTNAKMISDQHGSITSAVHRADLLELLLRQLPAGILETSRQFSHFEQSPGRVTAHFADGSQSSGDLLIGADGLWSSVRSQLRGEQPARYSGYTAWRAIAENPDNRRFDSGISTETWGQGVRFGWVPLTGDRVYWFAVKNAPERQEPDTRGHQVELLELFGSWHSPIPETIAGTPEHSILRHDIYDREPVANWGSGAVTLVGDAAHPMTPNTGQGAAQAVEDSVVLTDCLNRYVSTVTALRAYESIRAPRTRMITDLSRRIGSIAQIENPTLCFIRNLITRLTPDSVGARQIQEIVRWRAPTLKELDS
jgi:2-polyprenyl-6-methoxyphenol hydroxylase-like FAD-dependent oxidoreductase